MSHQSVNEIGKYCRSGRKLGDVCCRALRQNAVFQEIAVGNWRGVYGYFFKHRNTDLNSPKNKSFFTNINHQLIPHRERYRLDWLSESVIRRYQ